MDNNNGEIVVHEKVTLKVVEALRSHFSDPSTALKELIDNSVDAGAARISVTSEPGKLTIKDSGGKGGNIDDISKFFEWGLVDRTDERIGQYGVGKSAALYFAEGGIITLMCAKAGEDVAYVVRYNTSLSKAEQGQSERQLVVKRVANPSKRGFWQLEINRPNRSYPIPPRQVTEIKADLAETYRHRIGGVNLVNGVPQPSGHSYPKVSIFVNDENQPIKPEAIEALEVKKLMVPSSVHGKFIKVHCYILPKGHTQKAGFKFSYKGRIIENSQFFNFPSTGDMPFLNRVVGEIFIEDDADLQVDTTKDRMKQGEMFHSLGHTLKGTLMPWINEMSEKYREEEDDNEPKVPQIQRDMANEIKKMLANCMSEMGAIMPGSETGRRRPSEPGDPRTPHSQHKPPEKIGGATPPSRDAVVGENIKRIGPFEEWQLASLGQNGEAYRVETRGEGGKVLYLVINIDHPSYQIPLEKSLQADRRPLYLQMMGIGVEAALPYLFPDATPQELAEGQKELKDRLSRRISLYGPSLIRR